MENYKELLLKYLIGNIDKEQPSDTLNYEELNTEDRAEIGIEEPFFVTNYLQCLDSKGVANGKTIVYGGIIQNNIVTGFIALFEGTELLFVTSQYNTGTTFGRFKVLQVDEAGQLYGIELFNDRYRFILLNNISEVSKTGVRQVVLRQSYYLQGSTQIEEKNYSFSAGQYFEVKIEYVELSSEEFNNRMAAYTSNLDKLFAEGKNLEQSIKDRLGELKYE